MDLWLESPLQIKRSAGIQRGQADKIDAMSIARYARWFEDKAIYYKQPEKIIKSLAYLSAYRERLFKCLNALKIAPVELARVEKEEEIVGFIAGDSKGIVIEPKQKIVLVEKRMLELVKSQEYTRKNHELLTSIKGIGLLNAVAFIVLTSNFTRLSDPRKFACFSEVAPFEHSSGSSVRGKTRTSNIANKNMKALLTEAAKNAVRFDKKMKEYYQKKQQKERNATSLLITCAIN